MKRFGRFLKWCCAGMGWFEWYMLGISFCLGAALTATVQGNESLKHFWFGCLTIIISMAMITFVIKGVIAAWNRFKEHDDKVFNILKKDDIK